MIAKTMTRILALIPGLLVMPAAFAHPGHEHAQGWAARLSHAVIGWDQLLVLVAVGAVAFWLAVRNRG